MDDIETPQIEDIRNLLRKQYAAQFTEKCSHENLVVVGSKHYNLTKITYM
jgi:hypothetical protein